MALTLPNFAYVCGVADNLILLPLPLPPPLLLLLLLLKIYFICVHVCLPV